MTLQVNISTNLSPSSFHWSAVSFEALFTRMCFLLEIFYMVLWAAFRSHFNEWTRPENRDWQYLTTRADIWVKAERIVHIWTVRTNKSGRVCRSVFPWTVKNDRKTSEFSIVFIRFTKGIEMRWSGRKTLWNGFEKFISSKTDKSGDVWSGVSLNWWLKTVWIHNCCWYRRKFVFPKVGSNCYIGILTSIVFCFCKLYMYRKHKRKKVKLETSFNI